MTVPLFAITLAPLTRLVVTIIGNISGVNPTATDRPNRKASNQSPLVKTVDNDNRWCHQRHKLDQQHRCLMDPYLET